MRKLTAFMFILILLGSLCMPLSAAAPAKTEESSAASSGSDDVSITGGRKNTSTPSASGSASSPSGSDASPFPSDSGKNSPTPSGSETGSSSSSAVPAPEGADGGNPVGVEGASGAVTITVKKVPETILEGKKSVVIQLSKDSENVWVYSTTNFKLVNICWILLCVVAAFSLIINCILIKKNKG